MFYVVLYLDILIGGLVNRDNDYMLTVSANWGPNGYLNFSDQLTVIVGNIFYISALLMPFCVLWVS